MKDKIAKLEKEIEELKELLRRTAEENSRLTAIIMGDGNPAPRSPPII